MKKKINKVFISGSSNKILANNIAKNFNTKLDSSDIINFADGEISFVLKQDLKNKDVVLVQSLSFNPNINLLEILTIIDTVFRQNPRSVELLIPYLGYSRSDKEAISGESITAALIPKLFQAVGIDKILSLDVHSQRVVDYYNNQKINLVNIEPLLIFVEFLKNKKLNNPLIVSPDKGGLARSQKASKYLGIPYFQFGKKRPERNRVVFDETEIDLRDRDIIIFEDIIDTAGTIVGITKMLKDAGCANIYIFATHGLFSGIAIDRINNSSITKIIVTDTVDNGEKIILSDKIGVLSVAGLLASYVD